MTTDPASHAAIDGTGWVCGPLDGERLTKSGQVFITIVDPDGYRLVLSHRTWG